MNGTFASWLRAGVYYWLGYATPIVVVTCVRLAVMDDSRATLRYGSYALGIGLMSALCFGLVLLLLNAARPCRPKNVFGSAALGGLTACALLAMGTDWSADVQRVPSPFPYSLAAGVLLHAFTPGAPRRLIGKRRPPRVSPPVGVVHGCGIFVAAFALLTCAWYVAYGFRDGEAIPMKFMALPPVILIAGIFGLITMVPFGMGAAIALYLRGERTLRGWYCAAAGVGQVLLLVLLSWRGESPGYYLHETSWTMLTPILAGLGSALLPGARARA